MHVLLHLAPSTLEQATINPCLHWTFLDTHRKVWVSLLWDHCSFLLGPGAHTRFCLCPPRVYFPALCKFWQLYGEVNGDLLQEGLCHTQVCYTQSSCPCGSPLLTQTVTGDAQHSSVSSLWGSWVLVDKVCLSPLSVSGRNGT